MRSSSSPLSHLALSFASFPHSTRRKIVIACASSSPSRPLFPAPRSLSLSLSVCVATYTREKAPVLACLPPRSSHLRCCCCHRCRCCRSFISLPESLSTNTQTHTAENEQPTSPIVACHLVKRRLRRGGGCKRVSAMVLMLTVVAILVLTEFFARRAESSPPRLLQCRTGSPQKVATHARATGLPRPV